MTGFADGDATDAAYAAWVAAHDTDRNQRPAAPAEALARPAAGPLISLLLPLGFDRFGPLAATVAALRAQTYPHWELCVAGQPGTEDQAALFGLGARLRAAGPRPLGDIAEAANAALALAGGGFVWLLGVGDILPPDALAEVAAALGRHPGAELVYADEDAIDAAGTRHTPRLKAGWDPDLLLGCDAVGAAAIWAREALVRVGGLRPGLARAAPYDLALRATADIAPDRIHPLPRVLLHRPMERGQARQELMFGTSPLDARRAAAERLPPGAAIVPVPDWPAAQRITWPLPDPPPLASIVLLQGADPWALLRSGYGVLFGTDYPAVELLLEDAAAPPDLAQRPLVRTVTLPAAARSLPARANALAGAARGRVLVFLDAGVEVTSPGWLRELAAQALRPGVGAVGARLIGPDGQPRPADPPVAGAATPHGWLPARVARAAATLDGAAIALRRDAFAELGGFDAWHYPDEGAAADLCLRLREAGWRVLVTPFAELMQRAAPAGGSERQRDLLRRQWRAVLPAADARPRFLDAA